MFNILGASLRRGKPSGEQVEGASNCIKFIYINDSVIILSPEHEQQSGHFEQQTWFC